MLHKVVDARTRLEEEEEEEEETPPSRRKITRKTVKIGIRNSQAQS
jgi:hypothetical protein